MIGCTCQGDCSPQDTDSQLIHPQRELQVQISYLLLLLAGLCFRFSFTIYVRSEYPVPFTIHRTAVIYKNGTYLTLDEVPELETMLTSISQIPSR